MQEHLFQSLVIFYACNISSDLSKNQLQIIQRSRTCCDIQISVCLSIIDLSSIYLNEESLITEKQVHQGNSSKLENLPVKGGKICHESKTLSPYCLKLLKPHSHTKITISNHRRKLRKEAMWQGDYNAHLNANKVRNLIKNSILGNNTSHI